MSQIDNWRRVILDPQKSWVLFGNRTCVILVEPGEDLAAQATGLMGATSQAAIAVPSRRPVGRGRQEG